MSLLIMCSKLFAMSSLENSERHHTPELHSLATASQRKKAILRFTFVRRGGLPEAAGDQVASEAQRAVGPSVNVFDQHVHAGVLPLRGQLEQLVKSLRGGRKRESMKFGL